jgi:hypothetical protein
LRSAVTTAGGTADVDTATVTVRADVPPIGWRLDTASNRGTITLNGTAVPGTTQDCDGDADPHSCAGGASYAVFNRQTLALVTSGNMSNTTTFDSIAPLLDVAKKYTAAPTYIMVVNFNIIYAQDPLPTERKLLEALGVSPMSDADLERTFSFNQVSIVGVPGSPAGSAFISNEFPGEYQPERHAANMSGYLRLNPLSATDRFDFVLADQTGFDTDTSPVRSQITMDVGDKPYIHSVPTDGSSGFFMVRLNSRTLARDGDYFYVTNKPDGAQIPDEAKRMADDIAWATSPGHEEHGDLLVMLQAFGHPSGTSVGWMQAAQAIGRLGGNTQVFAQMNQGHGDSPHEGRYAFVARAGMDMPVAESSQSLTGDADAGVLDGVLARGYDDQYEPLITGPAGAINTDLVKIVNRPSPADGGFPTFTAGEAAAATFLGRDPDIIGVCEPAAPTCDVRKAYYEDYTGTNWANILTRLGEPAKEACAQPHPGFTPAECDKVRVELALEIGRRNTVEEYFGPRGLQGPFLGGAQIGALIDIAKIADQVKNTIKPPEQDNATSNALNIMSYVVRAGAVVPGASGYASALGGAFALAAYLTKDNGSPDLIGPQITAKAANLGNDLYDRYQAASAYFTTESKIIMSDWSKMSEVAALVNSKKWKLDDIPKTTATIRLATKQAIYQALVPVAYPVLYDLGEDLRPAANWVCLADETHPNEHLFQHSGGAAELTYVTTTAPHYGDTHLIAVGARKTVGSGHDAYIPAPPDSLTGPMFRSPDSREGDGIGLYKLQFYSPQNFDMFPKVLNRYMDCPKVPDPPGL